MMMMGNTQELELPPSNSFVAMFKVVMMAMSLLRAIVLQNTALMMITYFQVKNTNCCSRMGRRRITIIQQLLEQSRKTATMVNKGVVLP